MQLSLDRDSVAPADDVDSHAATTAVDGRRPLSLVIGEVVRGGYLPSMDRATWVVRAGRRGMALAVVAQQWKTPRMLVADVETSEFGDSLFFEYLAQVDPDGVVRTLVGNEPE